MINYTLYVLKTVSYTYSGMNEESHLHAAIKCNPVKIIFDARLEDCHCSNVSQRDVVLSLEMVLGFALKTESIQHKSNQHSSSVCSVCCVCHFSTNGRLFNSTIYFPGDH